MKFLRGKTQNTLFIIMSGYQANTGTVLGKLRCVDGLITLLMVKDMACLMSSYRYVDENIRQKGRERKNKEEVREEREKGRKGGSER